MTHPAAATNADQPPDVPPIATCHWQLLSDILGRNGFPNSSDWLGLAWGCRFPGSGVLFGAMSWNVVLAELTEATVYIESFADPATAKKREIALSAQDMPYVAEVDEYYLPGYPEPRRHVVHAISVLKRVNDRVHIVDLRISTDVTELTTCDFDRMRASPCQGRVEPYKLYALTQLPRRQPTPVAILASVRHRLQMLHPTSMAALERFIAWAGGNDEPIDVCRAAGERFQAAKLFEYLAREGIGRASAVSDRLHTLTDDWYLIHLLGTHSLREGRRRDRVIRLLTQVSNAERELAALVMP